MILLFILIFFVPLSEPPMELRPEPDGESLVYRV